MIDRIIDLLRSKGILHHEVDLCVDCPPKEQKFIISHQPSEFTENDPHVTDQIVEDVPKPGNWGVETIVEKYDGDYTAEEIQRLGIKPVEVVRSTGNLLMNAGAQRLIDQLIGATTLPFDNTHARLGVGNSSTAAVATHTDLQAAAGAGNRQFKMVDATFPSRASQTVTFKATFAAGEAQFAWLEWCIDRGTADGTTVTAPMFNRKVPVGGLGTKGAVSWALTVTITPA
jgi:hypothetical protein